MLGKIGAAAICASTAKAVSLRAMWDAIESHIVSSDSGVQMRDVLVTNDDNDQVDETVVVEREQDDGETCQIMLQEEEDEETGEVKQVYVSNCDDIDAEEYKREFKSVMDRTKALNRNFTEAREGRTIFKLGGRNYRTQSVAKDMQDKIDRIKIARKPAVAPAFTRVDLSSRQSLIERLRALYGNNKKVYTLPGRSNVDHSNYLY